MSRSRDRTPPLEALAMSRPRSIFPFLMIAVASVILEDFRPAHAQQTTTQKTETKPKARRYPPGTYMGRPIAQVMGYQGADWLIRDTREAEEQPEQMIDSLKIQPGQTVADIGAGVGYTSLKISKRVGPTGTVLATDLQPQMLKMLVSNAKDAGITNIQPIRSTQTDTKLPEGKVDLALMVDVYHEASDPEALLQGLKKALKPGGRLVLVEFRGEDPEVPIKPEHKMTLAQVRKEVEPQGFRFKESLEFLPIQHIIIFEKPVEAAAVK
jgi:SAM-dependent methyltransferase